MMQENTRSSLPEPSEPSEPSKPQITGVFVMGTDTEVGKTFHACRLAAHLQGDCNVGVYKPVASGCTAETLTDPQRLAQAAGRLEELDRVCPQQFSAALAPPLAARLEGRAVDEPRLLAGAQEWRERCDFLIVEGAGGVLSPISASKTCLDLAADLGFPVLLVAANRLGVVNHTLLSLQAIAQRDLSVLAIVLNDLPAEHASCDASRSSNLELLEQFCTQPILTDSVAACELLALHLGHSRNSQAANGGNLGENKS